VKPTISSGLQIFTNGKPESLASWAAKAVFPALGAPSRRMLTNPGPSVLAACWIRSSPSSRTPEKWGMIYILFSYKILIISFTNTVINRCA